MKKGISINEDFNWRISKNEQLLSAFLSLNDKNEAECFLRDIMTEKEIEEFANRLEAARLLTKSTQYAGIIETTGLSSTTIARISKWLKGPLGGYRLVLNKLHHINHQNFTKKGLS
jgi:TrpR-related protein YerC/YecD